jgi:hypothetical protein
MFTALLSNSLVLEIVEEKLDTIMIEWSLVEKAKEIL